MVAVAPDPPRGVGLEVLRGHRLLAALPVPEQRRLGAELAVVDLGLRDQVYDIDATITAVYFPLTCVMSMVAAVDDDVSVEIATAGFEGMAGLPVLSGAAASSHRCFCQVPGQALRLETAALHRFLAGDGALHDLLHRYTHAVMTFVGQNVACNQLHSVKERTARWLAHTHDRVHADTFPITQLRHTYATALVNAGVSLQALMVLLGHASAEMSLRYGRLFDTTVKDEYERALDLAKKQARTPASGRTSLPLTDITGGRDWKDTPLLKSRMAGGFCLRIPAQGACTYANICEHCPSYRAEPSSLPILAAQRVDADALARDAAERGWIDEADRHQRLVARLDTIINEANTG